MSIARPDTRPRPPEAAAKGGPRVNRDIMARQVRLIDESGEMQGVVATPQALEMAEAAGLDLVEISPNSDPPVCKILDYGKYKYELHKKEAEARKKQKVVNVKELKFRPTIDDNDFNIKLKAAHKFLKEGDKVKITLRFRGREMAHQELGTQLINRIKQELSEVARIEYDAKFEGRQIVMILAPVE